MNQEQVWNKIAEQWSSYRFKPIPEVEQFLKGKKGKILDLGCGSGRNIVPNSNVEYYGVDFSEEMLKYAENNSKARKIKAVFFKADIGKEKLPFSSDFFDCAVFLSTLHCIPEEKNRKKALEELYRVLKKDSEAMISVWNKEKDRKLEKIPAKEGLASWKKDGIGHDRYYYFYSKEELEKLLKEIGFKILSMETREGKTLIGKHARKNILVYAKK